MTFQFTTPTPRPCFAVSKRVPLNLAAWHWSPFGMVHRAREPPAGAISEPGEHGEEERFKPCPTVIGFK